MSAELHGTRRSRDASIAGLGVERGAAGLRAAEDRDRARGRGPLCDPGVQRLVPGALKNTLDWTSRPFVDNPLRDKRVAVIGASQGGFGATWAQAELRKILQMIGACVQERELALAHAQDAFGADGLLRDSEQRAALASIIESLYTDLCRRAA